MTDTVRRSADIVRGRNMGGPVFWMGIPHRESVTNFCKAYGLPDTYQAMAAKLGDTISVCHGDQCYKHPDGKEPFNPYHGVKEHRSHMAAGCFADVHSLDEIEAHPWPEVKYLDFTSVYQTITDGNRFWFTGLWSSLLTRTAEYFGLENLFILMYEEPERAQAVFDHVADYYTAASNKFCAGLAQRFPEGHIPENIALFHGIDLGNQRDLMMSPDLFRQFLLPNMKRLFAVGRKYGIPIILHSCGSIWRIIPDLADAGISVLHPLQAKAAGMSAAELVQYKGKVAFCGGIDTQGLLENGTPDEIKAEVKRVWNLLQPNLIVSPSHESLLPTVPPENILAMAQAVREINSDSAE
ncbi:MAG: uroporphyrinogen decarboxylase family protein [Oscillospiraceae bacterium]|jgi:uroporphyrinogen decarboxylase|nr:uroporphyrinogen decarboxylase family protein [Oscillospiraceae bacterium]